MFKPTRPFKDALTTHPNEPSLRIGTTVPDDAVNLAYYYNPTASDAEKTLTAEAPRQTIDHRVEDDYRYLFDQVEADDSLFPEAIYYEDEDGYSGRLGRMYVKWSPETHIDAKSVTKDEVVLVAAKGDEPKTIEYNDNESFNGTLYLDSADYEVTKTETRDEWQTVQNEVKDFEISYRKATGLTIDSAELDNWMVMPSGSGRSRWPLTIEVKSDSFYTEDGADAIRTWVNSRQENPYNGFTGFLTFSKFEYEPVGSSDVPINGSLSSDKPLGQFFARKSEWNDILNMDVPDDLLPDQGAIDQLVAEQNAAFNARMQEIREEADAILERSFMAEYDPGSDTYNYDRINYFIDHVCASYAVTNAVQNGTAETIKQIRDAMANQGDIVAYRTYLHIIVTKENGAKVIEARAAYHFKYSTRARLGSSAYNVIAVYTGTLLKDEVIDSKEVPVEYAATCHYKGLARQITYDYDGQAYYRGSVTKGNSMGSLNVDTPDELLMFPNTDDILRRKVESTDDFGVMTLVDFKNVEGEYFWLTDMFKNGEPCFYRYDLKQPLYSFKGPDSRGVSLSDGVSVTTSANRKIPDNYMYAVRLKERTGETNVYDASLYTTFKSYSADTFKATYKPFNDNSNTTEDIYGYPFMTKNHGYTLLEVEKESRTNMIKLDEKLWFADTRAYVSFSWRVKVERKGEYSSAGVLIKDPYEYTTREYAASIINKDYACQCEYNLFEDRGYIISPKQDGVRLSPSDMVFKEMALEGIAHTVPIRRDDSDLVYSVEITSTSDSNPVINIKCNPDGSGVVTAQTTVDTGFFNAQTGKYDKKLIMDAPYLFEDGFIFPGVMVKCIDSRQISVKQPRNDKLLEPWYPLIQFGHYNKVMSQYGNHSKVCYSMPEYDNQLYNADGRPYMDVDKLECEILNSHMVKVKLFPIYIKTGDANSSVDLFKVIDGSLYRINIKDISFSDGVIITEDAISENDKIVASYTYIEECYTYRGYWRSPDDFAKIDLNPNIYHTYGDLRYVPCKTTQTKNLFNKVVTFFLRPSYIYEESEPVLPGTDDDYVDIAINPETGKECYRIMHTEMKTRRVTWIEQEVVGQTPVYREEPIYAVTYYYEYENLNNPGEAMNSTRWNRILTNKQRYNTDNNYSLGLIQGSMGSFAYNSEYNSPYYSTAWKRTDLGSTGYEIANDTDMANYTFRTTFSSKTDSNASGTRIDILTYKTLPGSDDGEYSVKIYFVMLPPASRLYNTSKLDFTKNDTSTGKIDSDWLVDNEGNKDTAMLSQLNSGSSYTEGGRTKYLVNGTYAFLCVEVKKDNETAIRRIVRAERLHYLDNNGSALTTNNYLDQGNSDLWHNTRNVSVFIAKLQDEVRVWFDYGNPNAWLDGKMPSTTANFVYKPSYAPTIGKKSISYAMKANTRIQFNFPKQIALENTFLTNLGTIQRKEKLEPTGETKQVLDHYEDVYGPVEHSDIVTEPVTTYEYIEKSKTYKTKNDYCLYHRIDTFEPEKDTDIYIGSVYIRQNTSLHSTVLIDSRTRGGGVLTSISDGLRHELEAESDYYLDIGYYDGEPYQENGVIIVRIDRRVLKDFGGRFTPEDVDAKVKRWIGLGVFPIIEFVDTYTETELPQHTLEIEDTYANITDDTPEFTVECVDV